MFSDDPRKRVLFVKLVVSTTSVSPSQWPTESPIHFLTCAGTWPPFRRMIRASWTISTRIIT